MCISHYTHVEMMMMMLKIYQLKDKGYKENGLIIRKTKMIIVMFHTTIIIIRLLVLLFDLIHNFVNSYIVYGLM